MIDKPLQIIGEGQRENIIIENIAYSNYLDDSESGLLTGLTIHQVIIANGNNPTIRQCCIFKGKGTGISINNNGLGMIEYCDIYKNTLEGVYIDQGSNPTIRHCTIQKGKSYGIYITKTGLAMIESCRIQGNKLAGLMNKNRGSIDIIGSKIVPNKPPYGRIACLLTLYLTIPIVASYTHVLALTMVYGIAGGLCTQNLHIVLLNKGFRRQTTYIIIGLTVTVGALSSIGIVTGFTPLMLGIFLAATSAWGIMLVYRFFK